MNYLFRVELLFKTYYKYLEGGFYPMLYEFSITDSYNHTREQIMAEALVVAQSEFDFLGVLSKLSFHF